MAPGEDTPLDEIFSEQPSTVEPEGGQPRDEAGRFAPKGDAVVEPLAATVETPAATVETPAKVETPADHRIPLAEHLSEREKRQAAERRAEEAEIQLRRLSQRQQQPRQQEKPIDLLENPDGYAAALENRISRQLLARHLNASFEEAHEQHGEAFSTAYGALLRAVEDGDHALRERIANAGNPGRALMRWHQEREAIREIGGDLQGYRKKLLTDEGFRKEALSDAEFKKFVMSHPDFRKEAMEAWRAEAAGQSQQSTVTAFPPRLGSAPAARTSPEEGQGDSLAEIYAAPRRR